MEAHLIPARDRQIVDSLAQGTPAADLADFWGLPVEAVRALGDGTTPVPAPVGQFHAAHACWKPSQAAAAVLDAIGWDLDVRVPSLPRCSDRDAALLEAIVTEDVTLAEVGTRFDITRERVRQIVGKHTGLSTRDLSTYREQMREARRVAVGKMRATRMAAADANATLSDLAKASGLNRDEVADAIGQEEAITRRTRNTWMAGADADAVVAEIRRVAAMPGGQPLSGPFYDKHRGPGSIGSVRLVQRYDTWKGACEAAGVEAHKAARSDYTRRWSEENLVDWALQYVNAVGATGATYAGFVDWLRAHRDQGAPSAQTARNSLGGWLDILELVAVRQREVADGATLTVALAQRPTG